MNLYLKKFYNAVKDPSWPDVDTYVDFYRLPKKIKLECEHIHKASQRLQEIESHSFMAGLHTVFQKNKLSYVPLPKCGSVYYTEVFKSWLAWPQVTLQKAVQESKPFGFIVDPSSRWIRGLTQWVWQIQENSDFISIDEFLKKVVFSKKFPLVPISNQTTSYHDLLGSYIDQIHWIPMDWLGPEKTQEELLRFMQTQDSSVPISFHENFRIIAPPLKKLQLFEKIKTLHFQQMEQNENYIWSWHRTFAQDLKFYRKIIETFQ